MTQVAYKADALVGPETFARSFKVEASDDRGKSFATNGLRFSTIDGASDWAVDLSGRWFGLTNWRIAPSDDEPNRD